MSDTEKTTGWLGRLKAGLSRSSEKLGGQINGLFNKRKLDGAALEDLEDVLIAADLGVATAAKVAAAIGAERFDKEISGDQLKADIADKIQPLLEPVALPLNIDAGHAPHVILFCGVNGSGKTTTIGKLAHQFTRQGRSVLLAAGDTFRAAAVEQLDTWAGRAGCQIFKRETGADAAGLVFDALEQAKRDGTDIVMIDTAGRLQNKKHLMDELGKVVRVMRKLIPDAPHDCLLVLDATVGQNAHSQVETFKNMVAVTGLVMTKLDGTAKGGVLVSLADRFGLPVHAIGVGETADDLRPFEARAFARNLLGLDA